MDKEISNEMTQDRVAKKLAQALMEDPNIVRLILKAKAKNLLEESGFEYEKKHTLAILNEAVELVMSRFGFIKESK